MAVSYDSIARHCHDRSALSLPLTWSSVWERRSWCFRCYSVSRDSVISRDERCEHSTYNIVHAYRGLSNVNAIITTTFRLEVVIQRFSFNKSASSKRRWRRGNIQIWHNASRVLATSTRIDDMNQHRRRNEQCFTRLSQSITDFGLTRACPLLTFS